jgi:hypothetical protein
MDDALLRRARQWAAKHGSTLTRVLEDALREYLGPRPSTSKSYNLKLLTRKAAVLPGVDLSDRDALYSRMENEK